MPIVGPTAPEPLQRTQPMIIVQPVTPAVPFLVKNEPELAPKRIREEFSEQFGNNSPNNSDSELFPNSFEPTGPAPKADIAPYKKIGQVGRKRKYELPGNRGEIPVKKVVLFRHIEKRHWPGMSQDMRDWYEHYYFKKPIRAERAKDAEDYNRHVKSWERGRAWIAEYEQSKNQGTGTVGNSEKIVAYRKRQTS